MPIPLCLHGEWDRKRFCGLLRNQTLLQPSPAQLCPCPQIPLVPLTPALSILLNICLMLKLNYLTWLRFSIWLLIGKCGPHWGPRWAVRRGQGGQRAETCPSGLCNPCRTHGVFRLWHLAQQGEPSGATAASYCTLCGVPQQQPGGEGAGCTAPQPGTEAGHQSMRTARGLPILPRLLRRPEGLGAPSVQSSSCL